MFPKSFYALITITIINNVVCKDYTNYTLYKALPQTERHLIFLSNATEKYEIDYWVPPSAINRFVQFVLSPEHKSDFFHACDEEGLQLYTVIYDIQSEFDQQIKKEQTDEPYDWNSYYSLNDTYTWIHELYEKYKDEMDIVTLGKTAEGRPILAVKVVLKESSKRSSVIIEGGIHAREWISPAFVTYVMYTILTADYAKDKILRDIALTYEWYFIPILNPDGYQYTFTTDRLWVKNRYNEYGVDLNANFPYRFGTVGISPNSTSSSYCGPYPFSEAESRALRGYMLSQTTNLEYYISIHSYGQFIIIPYDDAKEHMDNYDEMMRITSEAIGAISNRYGTEYTAGNHYEMRAFLRSGCSTSWAKFAFKVPYALSIYLRDKETYGHALPPDQILPTCLETMDGLLTILTNRTEHFKKPEHLKALQTALVHFMDERHSISGQNKVFRGATLIMINFLLVFLVNESFFIVK